MFNLFKIKPSTDAGPTKIEEHGQGSELEVRMKFRRDMLCRSVRDAFNAIGVLGHMYKFKVSRLDERGHTYVVMIEIAQSFSVDGAAKVDDFGQIETLIKNLTRTQCGVNVQSVYWRTNESALSFSSKTRRSVHSPQERRPTDPLILATPKLPKRGLQATSRDSVTGQELSASSELVLDSEVEAFERALKEGRALPFAHENRKRYTSDMAPLSPDDDVDGGTEYGDLS